MTQSEEYWLLQKHCRNPPQARRNALDRQRRQRHHRPAMRNPLQPLRRLPGTNSKRSVVIALINMLCVHLGTFADNGAARSQNGYFRVPESKKDLPTTGPAPA